MKTYVALGSNLGDREAHLIQGAKDIEELPDCRGLVMSSIYETAPMGPQDQPDYLNSVCSFECLMDPHDLLAELNIIERQHGRVQATERWRARPLDLDIILFGNQHLSTADLTVPHAGLAQRSFVLWPLAELNESLLIPGLGSVQELKGNCQQFGIRPYEP